VPGQLAAIWTELLGVPAVGPQDDFFQLGGHSLLATRVLARIRDTLGVQLALRDLFEASTLDALARKVQAALDAAQVDEDREEIEF
jgi:acyl carrier protein